MLESIDKQTSKIFWAVLAKDAESTLSLYLDCLYRQDYDKSLITLYFRTNDNRDNTEEIIQQYISNHGHEYGKVIYDGSSVDARLKDFDNHEWNPFRFAILGSIRNKSLELALESDCDFYFVSDLDNFIIPQTLSSLVKLNVEIVAPLLHNARSREAKEQGLGSGDAYSNFHCDMDEIGAYRHSPNYLPILNRDIIGIHEVPLVHCTYLVHRDAINKIDYLRNPENYEYRNFSISAENNGVKQYLDNRHVYGVLTLLNDSQTAASHLPTLEWFATQATSVSFKVFNCGEDEVRNTNALQIRNRFNKIFPELISETIHFKTLEDVHGFLRSNKNFKIESNRDYPGWRLGALGIWASWYKALANFLNTNQSALIILEDDLWFRDDLFDTIAKGVGLLPEHWDFLTLFSPENEWHRFANEEVDAQGYLTAPFATWSAAAVIFSRDGAKKVLSYISQGIDQHCDLFLFIRQSNSLRGYALTPNAMRDKISIYMDWKSTIGLPNMDLYNLDELVPSI